MRETVRPVSLTNWYSPAELLCFWFCFGLVQTFEWSGSKQNRLSDLKSIQTGCGVCSSIKVFLEFGESGLTTACMIAPVISVLRSSRTFWIFFEPTKRWPLKLIKSFQMNHHEISGPTLDLQMFLVQWTAHHGSRDLKKLSDLSFSWPTFAQLRTTLRR